MKIQSLSRTRNRQKFWLALTRVYLNQRRSRPSSRLSSCQHHSLSHQGRSSLAGEMRLPRLQWLGKTFPTRVFTQPRIPSNSGWKSPHFWWIGRMTKVPKGPSPLLKLPNWWMTVLKKGTQSTRTSKRPLMGCHRVVSLRPYYQTCRIKSIAI